MIEKSAKFSMLMVEVAMHNRRFRNDKVLYRNATHFKDWSVK